MRDYLLDTLPPTTYRRFLVYLMGPYKGHRGEDSEMFAFLERLRDDLRDVGFNAFLATDADIELEEMDAGTQSLQFARASNAVVFVVPGDGRNLGVGIEVGAVLEDMSDRAHERVLFVHESGVRSAMIRAVADRWDATVRSYDDEAELVYGIRVFARDVMRREGSGELSFPPEE
ncbi:DUF7509 family protein [Haloprofundus salilacus]|uniref:DUF7509 family protein n=1 Tax=Haloprofundus salilacus TaxID=2876190 RepID=UPI001CCA3353|nr:hypothetical protein [Haloprofundus salilacus]